MPHLALISTEELAHQMRYAGAHSAFREWLASLRITPVPGRKGYYDPALVRRRLDEAQGLVAGAAPHQHASDSAPVDLIAARRARRAAY